MGGCPLVFIEWEDSARPVPEWSYLEETGAEKVVLCASVGWLIHDGKDVKSLAPNMGALGDHRPQVCGVIRIPARAIVRLVKLDEPRLTSSSDGTSSALSAPSSRPETAPSPRET